jgi:hypothetical protein
MSGTKTRIPMMAATMPMMAEGLQPSCLEVARGLWAGGACGMSVDVEVSRAARLIELSTCVRIGAILNNCCDGFDI